MSRHLRRLHWDRFCELVRSDYYLKYHQSALGVLWSLLKPMFMIIVLYLVFSVGRVGNLAGGIDNFAVFIIVGIMLWNFYSNALIRAVNIYLERHDIITNFSFKRQYLILSVIISETLVFGIYLLLVLGYSAFIGTLSWVSLILLVPILEIILLTFFLGLILAPIQVRYRDLSHITELYVFVGFFLSPIFYNLTYVPDKVLDIFLLNPITRIIIEFREIILLGQIPDASWFLVTFLLIAVFGFIAFFLFRKLDPNVAEEI